MFTAQTVFSSAQIAEIEAAQFHTFLKIQAHYRATLVSGLPCSISIAKYNNRGFFELALLDRKGDLIKTNLPWEHDGYGVTTFLTLAELDGFLAKL